MLNGSLDTFALPVVLRFVCASPVSGRLEVRRPGSRGSLSLRDGLVVDATLEDAGGEEPIDAAVRLLDGAGGEFSLHAGPPPAGSLSLAVDDLLRVVEARRHEWREVLSAVGSLDGPFALDPAAAERGKAVSVAADEWRMLSMLAGGASVRRIATETGNGTFAAARAVAGLVRRGVVKPGAPAGPRPEPPRPAPVIRVPDAGAGGDPLRGGGPEKDDAIDAVELLRELGLDDEEPQAPQRRPGAPQRDRRLPFRR